MMWVWPSWPVAVCACGRLITDDIHQPLDQRRTAEGAFHPFASTAAEEED